MNKRNEDPMQTYLSLSSKTIFMTALIFELGCGGAQVEQVRPSVALEPAASEDEVPSAIGENQKPIGKIDPRMLGGSSEGYPTLIKLHVATNGDIQKISAEHHSLSNIPASTRSLALQEFPESKIEKYETEIIAGEGFVHEVEVRTLDDRKCEVSTKETLLRYVRCAVPLAALPTEVTATVAKLFPHGVITDAKEETKPSSEIYSIKVKDHDAIHKLHISKSGNITKHSIRVAAWIELPRPIPRASK
jgi:ribosomal protein S8